MRHEKNNAADSWNIVSCSSPAIEGLLLEVFSSFCRACTRVHRPRGTITIVPGRAPGHVYTNMIAPITKRILQGMQGKNKITTNLRLSPASSGGYHHGWFDFVMMGRMM